MVHLNPSRIPPVLFEPNRLSYQRIVETGRVAGPHLEGGTAVRGAGRPFSGVSVRIQVGSGEIRADPTAVHALDGDPKGTEQSETEPFFGKKDLRPSRFAHQYSRGEEVCLFHSLSRETVFGNRALSALFSSFSEPWQEESTRFSLSDEVVHTLLRKGLLVGDENADQAHLQNFRNLSQAEVSDGLTQMYLLPTSRCNLACSYCYVSIDDRSPLMSPEVAVQAVRYFQRHSSQTGRRSVFYYGGEPLLNKPAVFAAAQEVRALERDDSSREPVELNLLTNGTPVDGDTAKRLAEFGVKVSVSIDGPALVHDTYRRGRNKKGTLAAVLKAVDTLREAGIEPGASVTITPKGLQHWPEVLAFLCDHLGLKSIGFNPFLPGPEDPNTYEEEDLHPTAAIIGAYRKFRTEGVYEDRMMRRVKPFVERWFFLRECPGTGLQVAVAPDGTAGPCQGLQGTMEFFPLHVVRDFDVFPLDHPLFSEWAARLSVNTPVCLDCPAISICGGGCPIAALRDHGSILEIDQRVCEQVKPIHEWLMWELHDYTTCQG